MKWITHNTPLQIKLSILLMVFLFIFFNLKQSVFASEDNNQNQFSAWQDSNYILKAFEEIALKNEYTKTQKRILKWQKPILYQFHYEQLKPIKMVETLFTIHLTHLSHITGLEIKPTNRQANLNIYLTQDNHYADVIKKHTGTKVKNIERDSHCMGSFKTNQHNEIIEATIVLPVDHVYSRGLLIACVVEETTQVLGLPNDASWVNPSIANDDSKIEFLTGLDYILLKLLYSKQITAGMSQSESRPLLKKEIEILKNSGEIHQASSIVNSEGLYQLAN